MVRINFIWIILFFFSCRSLVTTYEDVESAIYYEDASQESEEFLDELNDFACAESRTYFHDWDEGDAVVWDNRRLMHRVTPYDMTESRRMWHTRIAGNPDSELADNYR